MPKLSEREDVLGAIAGVQGWLNQKYFPFQSYGGGAWVTDRLVLEAVVKNGGNLYFWRPFDDPNAENLVSAWTPPAGANAIAGGGGAWMALSEAADRSSLLIGSRGAIPHAGWGDIAPDGTIAFKTIYQSDWGLTIIPADVEGDWPPHPDAVWPDDLPPGWINIPDAFPVDIQALPGGKAIWRGGAYGRPVPKPYHTDAMGLRLVHIGTEEFLLYWSNARPGLILQPNGVPEGYVLDTEGLAFNHHIIGGPDYATIVWSRTQGEGPTDLVKLHASRSGLTYLVDWNPNRVVPTWQSLAPPRLPLPVLQRPTWIGWFEFAQSMPAPGNAVLAVRNIHGAIPRPVIVTSETEVDVTGELLGHYIGGNSVEEIEAAAKTVAAKGHRPIAYWDGRAWPRPPVLPPGGWICQQAYCRNTETPLAFERELRQQLQTLSGPVALVCQQYTSNATLTTDIESIIPVFLRLANEFSNIVALLPFSGGGRATGYTDHPEIQDEWQATLAQTRTPVFIPYPKPTPPDPKPPDPPKPEPPTYFHKARRFEVPMEPITVALRSGKIFARIDPADKNKNPNFKGWYPVRFDRDNPNDEQCQFTLSQPEAGNPRLKLQHIMTGALLNADATEHGGGNICVQFNGKPTDDWGGYEQWDGWDLDGIHIVEIAYDRDGERYTSASLTVVELAV